MRRHLCSLAIAALLWSLGSTVLAFGPYELQLEALNDFVEAWPRQPITLLMHVTNGSERSLELFPAVHIPEGWHQIIPLTRIALAAGESQMAFVTLMPAATSGAGEYQVRVEYGSREAAGPVAAAEFTVLIMSDTTIDVSVLDALDYVSDEPYTVEFLVRNAGNVHQDLRLWAKENLGFEISVEPTDLHLAPGDSAVVALRVQVDTRYGTSRQHRIQLMVDDAESERTLVSASSQVTIVPAAPSKFIAYHVLPITVTGKVEADKDGVSTSWSLYGRGSMPGVDSGHIRLRATKDRQFLSLTWPGTALSIGDQVFYLSPLTDAGTWGEGVQMRSVTESWSSQLQWYADADHEEIIGGRVAYHALPKNTTVALNYLHRMDDFAGIQSVETIVVPDEQLTARAEYGAHVGGDYGSTAMALSGNYQGNSGDTTVDWQRSDAGYRGMPDALKRLAVRHKIDVGRRTCAGTTLG
jgi:hypothetical protein